MLLPSLNWMFPPVIWSERLGRSYNTTRLSVCGLVHVNFSQLPAVPPTVAHSAVVLLGKPPITPSIAFAAVWPVLVFCDDALAVAERARSGPDAGVEFGMGVGGTAVGVGVGVLVGTAAEPEVCSSSTQSASPAALLPGVVNCRVPVLVNGEPLIDVYVPLVGSYHSAVTAPLSCAMFTPTVPATGRYATTRLPSLLRSAVT